MYAYCVFCNTLKRSDLAEAIRQLLGGEAVVPKIVQRKWVKGKAFEAVHDYLPGYLFIYADVPMTDFAPLFRLENVYRVLGERDSGYCLTGSDLAFARMLHDCGGTIGVLKTYKEFAARLDGLVNERASKSDRIRNVIAAAQGAITKREIVERCPDISVITVSIALKRLCDEGYICKTGNGRSAAYVRIE